MSGETPNPQHSRRGVLLLVVLSLLVLFALISVTFVLIAGQYRRSSRAASKAEMYGDDPRSQLDHVFAQIVRDTDNPNSSLRAHSLLNDMYGNDGVKGTNPTGRVTAAVNVPGVSQFIDLTATIDPPANSDSPVTIPQTQTSGFFNGCVLTMTDGPAANLSTRVVGSRFSGTYTFRVMAFNSPSTLTTSSITGNFIVNGKPFNGTGAGYQEAALGTRTSLLDRLDDSFIDSSGTRFSVPFALLPNLKYFPKSFGRYTALAGPGAGGADEDYDAPDPQNMLLAYMPVAPTSSSQILPSLHRQDLIAFMQNTANLPHWNDGAVTGGQQLRRQVILRPLQVPDHPNFTGSNPDPLDPITKPDGQWDVDNDGDGIMDSIWVDVGIPVQTTPDGRRFKPLAAILCLDMDGRLNVNAHGSIAQVETQYSNTVTSGLDYPYAGGATPNILIRGQGYGPADISLAPLFGASPNQFNLLVGGTTTFPGRYGEFSRAANVPTGAFTNYTAPAVATSPPYPGTTGVDDAMSMLKQFELPHYAATPITIPTSFSTPADLWGRTYLGVDVRGMPMISYPDRDVQSFDDPYEINLNQRSLRAVDEPFTAAELERILRQFDFDASALPDRLRVLLGTGIGLPSLRNMVTTDSFDLPVPSSLPTRELRATFGGGTLPFASQNIVGMVNATIGTLSPTPPEPAIYSLLTPEVIAGQRVNLNRPFGNGRDDDGNGIVDEPAEALTEEIWFPATGPTAPTTPAAISTQFSNIVFDHDNDGLTGATDGPTERTARYLLAKNLYVLMMLLNGGRFVDFDGNTGNNTPEETARGFAQWAVNVVDFRDRDSIMTPFEYDVTPFTDETTPADGNPWDVDGLLSSVEAATSRRVVWGCERPELLITETLAFHDRRTENLNTETVDNTVPLTSDSEPEFVGEMGSNNDRDFDQRLRPRGSLFIELYNPWTTQTSNKDQSATPLKDGRPAATEASGEFYTLDTVTNNVANGVNLQAAPGGSPVWRMLIFNSAALQDSTMSAPDQPKDPDDPVAANQPVLTDIERSIYFVNPGGITGHGQAHFASNALSARIAPLLPGRYAVVGPAGQEGLNTATEYVNTIGRKQSTSAAAAAQDGTNSADLRQIVLAPNANPNTADQVQILANSGRNPVEPVYPNIQYPIAAVIDQILVGAVAQPASLSISEPYGGYTGTNWNAPAGMAVAGSEGQYSPPLDVPLDTAAALKQNGTTLNYKIIHLQRLADPTIAWDATTNPYRTIDTMSVDLTAFNGVTNDTDLNASAAAIVGIASLQRGDSTLNANNLWRREPLRDPLAPPAAVPAGTPAHNYDYSLRHSLGFLNTNYGDYSPSAGPPATAFVQTDTTAAAVPQRVTPAYVGAPKALGAGAVNPFTSLIWNNRPFVSAAELMLVPKTQSSQLLLEYMPGPPSNYYAAPAGSTRVSPVTPSGHLLNFFQATGGDAANAPGAFYRLLDYVHVPSPFVGTEIEINPTSTTGLAAAELAKEKQMLSQFHAPFNKVSTYREPGRVNINTMPADNSTGSDGPTWRGVIRTTNALVAPQFSAISQSRRGYVPTSGTAELGFNNLWPSFFSNPFRSPAGSLLTLPPLSLPPATGQTPRNEAEVSMLRSNDPTSVGGTAPLFATTTSASAAEDPNRNAYFQYQNYLRLNNLLTTRSNVYAVWITVGYFEVTAVPVSTVYPDGYQLGQELGSDSGEITRHRAFYMYDRTIPVCFEPGKDHNFEKGILVKRYIE